MSHINEKPHKIDGKIVYYLNGDKWLIRQTCKTKKQAEELLKEIKERRTNLSSYMTLSAKIQ